jgi:hypothetical protein
MPPVMLKYLAVVCTNQLNMFPAKGGISDYLSPHVILTGKNIDYTKHCQVPFGAYVQCNNKNNPTNSNAPQTLDAIYLRPATNLQGGHKVMNLATGQVLTRPRVREIPVTPVVIKAVEKLAAQRGIKSLKLESRTCNIFHPANWIAGVDYKDDEIENDENENEDYEADPNDGYKHDEELEDEQHYDRVDQEELDELLAEPGSQSSNDDTNPNNKVEAEEEPHEENDEEQAASVTDKSDYGDEELRRSKRDVPCPVKYSHNQVDYAAKLIEQDKKSVKYAAKLIEHCHNIVTNTTKDSKVGHIEYTERSALIAAQVNPISTAKLLPKEPVLPSSTYSNKE